jgi:hypothetical protein
MSVSGPTSYRFGFLKKRSDGFIARLPLVDRKRCAIDCRRRLFIPFFMMCDYRE